VHVFYLMYRINIAHLKFILFFVYILLDSLIAHQSCVCFCFFPLSQILPIDHALSFLINQPFLVLKCNNIFLFIWCNFILTFFFNSKKCYINLSYIIYYNFYSIWPLNFPNSSWMINGTSHSSIVYWYNFEILSLKLESYTYIEIHISFKIKIAKVRNRVIRIWNLTSNWN